MSNNKIYHLGIVSGKGGVGKTSITASLACILKDMGISLLSADTDVDAPNLAILFQANGEPLNQFKVKTTEKATLNEANCIHCYQCIEEKFCRFDALSWNEEKKIPIIDSIACEGCHACQWLCPQGAFDINSVESGTISIIQSKYGFPVITGETILGAQTSGKLVTELKKQAEEMALKEGNSFILIDGPPGIGCPVIAAVADLDYTIIIIEPTAAALHDAIRVMKVIDNFDGKYGVIINKSDMYIEGKNKILEYLSTNDISLLGEIPLDDNWPHSIAKGLPIIKYNKDSQASKALIKIANLVKQKYDAFFK